ncbi:MAG TPA: cyclase family protein [Candidatus Limivivens intestinipullorum]|uniref:Cyclase family protein n=1 Tax=Candidatus Limivivens intestinipullorum TaxID=2840858 RepID=A0A9D1JIN6_9FIRM|nr:cyclase family protein [Candidatus Limivivens intestinipullorum]
MKLIDLSTDFYGGMPKPPSAPEVVMKYAITQSEKEEKEKGYSNKLEQFTITTHVGTHFDAPSHFTAGGKNIDEFPLEMFYRVPTLVLHTEKEEYGEITVSDLEAAQRQGGSIQAGDFVILNTGFYRFYQEEKYVRTPYLSWEAADYLACRNVSMVGIDSFTVDDVRRKEKPAHVRLLKEAGILIVECIVNLDKLSADRFFSCCFPIKVQNGSGGFTRLTAIFEEE